MDEAQQGRVGFERPCGGPGDSIQRPSEIKRLPTHLKSIGDSAFLLVNSAATVRDAIIVLNAFTSSLVTSS